MRQAYRFTTNKAQQTDIDDICCLENEIFRSFDRFSQRRLLYLLSSINAIVTLCCAGTLRIGYGISLVNNLRNGVRKGRIYSIGILPDYQTKGAGAVLLRVMELDLRRSSVLFITLETRKGKSGAADFFRQHGYKKIQDLPNYYPHGSGIRMRKEVD